MVLVKTVFTGRIGRGRYEVQPGREKHISVAVGLRPGALRCAEDGITEVTPVQIRTGRSAAQTVGASLAAVATIAILAGVGPATAQSLNLRAVRDPQNRFTIAVPATWNVQTQAKNPSVEAKSPAPKTTLPDSLDVIVYDMPHALSAQDCVHESDMVLRFAIHSWTTVKEGPVSIGGEPGYSRVYNWKSGNGEQRQSVQACVTHGGRVFMAVGTTENTQAKIDATMPLLQHAIATLKPNLAEASTTEVVPAKNK